jgi:PqqD family protein of HPr-rel-A system
VVVSRRETALSRRLGDDTVVLDPDSGAAVSLNATGSRLWERLEVPRTTDELAAVLVDEWQLTPAQARTDVSAFLASLSGRGLVELTPPSAPETP